MNEKSIAVKDFNTFKCNVLICLLKQYGLKSIGHIYFKLIKPLSGKSSYLTELNLGNFTWNYKFKFHIKSLVVHKNRKMKELEISFNMIHT